MALIVVNQAEEAFLDLILAVNYTLRLFKVDPGVGLTQTQKDALTEASFLEADFPGYSSVALTGGAWTTTPGDPGVATYAQQSFTRSSTGTAQVIYGYYVTRTSDGALRWFEYLGSPTSMELASDLIQVTPRMTLRDEEDAAP